MNWVATHKSILMTFGLTRKRETILSYQQHEPTY